MDLIEFSNVSLCEDNRKAMGLTALIGVASAGNPDVVKLLVARGADVNAKADICRLTLTLLIGFKRVPEKNLPKVETIRRERLGTLHADGMSALDAAKKP